MNEMTLQAVVPQAGPRAKLLSLQVEPVAIIGTMFICFICHLGEQSVKELFIQFKKKHALVGCHGTYLCGQSSCGRSLHDKHTLSKHVFNEHKSDCGDSECVVRIDARAECQNVATEDVEMENEVFSDAGIAGDQDIDLSDTETLAAEFICRCKHASASLTVVNEMI